MMAGLEKRKIRERRESLEMAISVREVQNVATQAGRWRANN
jgi:hypothetical protein